MSFKQLLALLFLLTATLGHGQVASNKFEQFANTQDSLFMLAYEQKDAKSNTTWTTYKTNNPTLFWQTP